MNWNLRLSICFLQVLLYTNAMEKRSDTGKLFLSIRLPFSVKRGEVINVPVSVFNPLDKKNVTISLHNSKAEYEFLDFDNKVISKSKVTKSIKLDHQSAATISFLIRPVVVGNVTLKFEALTSFNFAESLNVIPEGITQFVTDAFLVNLKREPEQKSEFALELPEDLVPDSQHYEVGVVGDILGLVLKNLNSLVRMSTDCGEATMSSLLPNYLVMQYMQKSKRLTSNVTAWLRHNLETGYKNLLNCRNMDGSFSSFHSIRAKENSPAGSTFLTSYILRFLPHFKEFINVSETIIEEGLDYLSKQQSENGKFSEESDNLYSTQRNHVTLTGAAVLAFLENHAYTDKYLQNITKGLEFMANNLKNYESLHAQTLAAYALKQAKHESSEKIGLIKWLSETNIEIQSKWWQYVYLSNFERTSFNLLKLLKISSTKIDYIEPTVKRLIAQQKSFNDFASTKHTIVGLTDIIKFAEFDDYEAAKMDVSISLPDKIETIKLTEDNGNLYKSVELPPNSRSLKIAAKGNGTALVQIAFQYNTFKDQNRLKPSFTITTIKLDDRSRHSYLRMLVCVTYVGKRQSSNMTLLEIYTPSGYVIDDAFFKQIQKLETVKNIELKNSDTLLVIYFDQLHKNVATCLTLEALRTHDVAMQKPVPIIMYDYSDKDRRAVIFYDINSKLCDICGTQEECSKCK